MPNIIMLVLGRQTVERYGAEGITKLQKFYKDVAAWGLRPDQPWFESQLVRSLVSCVTPVNSINLLEARWFHPCSGDGAGMVMNKHFWRTYQGQALCCLYVLLFFNPLTSLDCWENEIQPHFVFIASRAALEITKCSINVFCRKKYFQQSESWS